MLTDVSRCEASRNFHFVSMDSRESGKQGSWLVVDSCPEGPGLTRLRFCVLLQDRSAGAWERAIGRALLVLGMVSVPIVTYMMHAGHWPSIRKLNYNLGLALSGWQRRAKTPRLTLDRAIGSYRQKARCDQVQSAAARLQVAGGNEFLRHSRRASFRCGRLDGAGPGKRAEAP
jgi:hypothetical protein